MEKENITALSVIGKEKEISPQRDAIFLDLQRKKNELESSKYNYYEFLNIEEGNFVSRSFPPFSSFYEKVSFISITHFSHLSVLFKKLSKLSEIEKEDRDIELMRTITSLRCNFVYFCSEAYCVLSHPKLRKIYNKFYYKGNQQKFVEFIGSQFDFFFRELDKEWSSERVCPGTTSNSESCISLKGKLRWIQSEVLRTARFLEKEEELSKMKNKLFCFLVREVEKVFSFYTLNVEGKYDLSSGVFSSFNSNQKTKIREIFKKNLKLIFWLKNLKWQIEKESMVVEEELAQLRVFSFKNNFFEKGEEKNCSLFNFCQRLICWLEKKKHEKETILVDQEISDFSETINVVSNFLSINDFFFEEIIFFSEKIDKLRLDDWESCHVLYKEFVSLIQGEKDLNTLRNNYYKFLFLDDIIDITHIPNFLDSKYSRHVYTSISFLDWNEDFKFIRRKKIEKNCSKIKKIREKWIIGKRNKVWWRGCNFPIQEALGCLEEACFVFSYSSLEALYKFFLNKGKQKDFVELVSFFRKEIEEKNKVTENKHIFISDQSQDWLKKNVLEVAEKLDDFSEIDETSKLVFRETIKKALILVFEAEIKNFIEWLFFYCHFELREFNKEMKTLFNSDFLSVGENFCSHLEAVFLFRLFFWQENKSNISGIEEFTLLWRFKEELLKEPKKYFFDFGKDNEEVNFLSSTPAIDLKTFLSDSGEKQAEFIKKTLDIVGGDNDFFRYDNWKFFSFLVAKLKLDREKKIESEISKEWGAKKKNFLDNFDISSKKTIFFIVAFIFFVLGFLFFFFRFKKKQVKKSRFS